jgi:hypothetical protein
MSIGGRIAVAASALLIVGMSASAQAACIEFRETGGQAMLINHCTAAMNVGCIVGPEGQALSLDGRLYRSSVAAQGTKVLWSREDAPVSDRFQVKVFSCMTPTSLVYQRGGRPTCQMDFASQG